MGASVKADAFFFALRAKTRHKHRTIELQHGKCDK
jgi:hypothetical protein